MSKNTPRDPLFSTATAKYLKNRKFSLFFGVALVIFLLIYSTGSYIFRYWRRGNIPVYLS